MIDLWDSHTTVKFTSGGAEITTTTYTPTDTDIANATGDMILDATWSPQSQHEVVLHSTILHFLVRAVAGDRD